MRMPPGRHGLMIGAGFLVILLKFFDLLLRGLLSGLGIGRIDRFLVMSPGISCRGRGTTGKQSQRQKRCDKIPQFIYWASISPARVLQQADPRLRVSPNPALYR